MDDGEIGRVWARAEKLRTQTTRKPPRATGLAQLVRKGFETITTWKAEGERWRDILDLLVKAGAPAQILSEDKLRATYGKERRRRLAVTSRTDGEEEAPRLERTPPPAAPTASLAENRQAEAGHQAGGISLASPFRARTGPMEPLNKQRRVIQANDEKEI